MAMSGTSINDWLTPAVQSAFASDKTHNILVDAVDNGEVDRELPWYKNPAGIKAAVNSAISSGLVDESMVGTTPYSRPAGSDDNSLFYVVAGALGLLFLVALLK